jgi:cobalamin-dependent methionine synthase I
MNESSQYSVSQREPTSHQNQKISPRKSKKQTNYNQDEISDLESISQLLSDRSTTRRKTNQAVSSNKSPTKSNAPTKSGSSSSVNEKRKLIEKQLDQASRNAKPSPNAVPVGFQTTASRLANQVYLYLIYNLLKIIS